MSTTFIYGLFDPCTGECRYQGKSGAPFVRLQEHLSDARSGKRQSHRSNWIRTLLAQNLLPELAVLDEVAESEWQFWDRWWIAYLRAIGCRLTNHTAGGEGSLGYVPTPEERRRHSELTRGRPMPSGFGEKVGRILKGRPMPKPHDFSQRMSIAMRRARDRKRGTMTVSLTTTESHVA
jgi:hypothetical protein